MVNVQVMTTKKFKLGASIGLYFNFATSGDVIRSAKCSLIHQTEPSKNFDISVLAYSMEKHLGAELGIYGGKKQRANRISINSQGNQTVIGVDIAKATRSIKQTIYTILRKLKWEKLYTCWKTLCSSLGVKRSKNDFLACVEIARKAKLTLVLAGKETVSKSEIMEKLPVAGGTMTMDSSVSAGSRNPVVTMDAKGLAGVLLYLYASSRLQCNLALENGRLVLPENLKKILQKDKHKSTVRAFCRSLRTSYGSCELKYLLIHMSVANALTSLSDLSNSVSWESCESTLRSTL